MVQTATLHIGLMSRIIRGLDSVLLYVIKVRGSVIYVARYDELLIYQLIYHLSHWQIIEQHGVNE